MSGGFAERKSDYIYVGLNKDRAIRCVGVKKYYLGKALLGIKSISFEIMQTYSECPNNL